MSNINVHKEEAVNPQQNIMGTMPIPKLLIRISLPIAISMLIQALYNIIDSIFVAQLGEDALTAVSLTFPIQMLIIAVAVGTGVGMNALISRYLGAKQPQLVKLIAQNAVFLAIISGIVFAIIGLCFSTLFFTLQTSNQTVIDYGSRYMLIVTTFSMGAFLQITFERNIQATGRTMFSMISQAVGAIINIVLDPILIFGLFGFPRLEVAGAAIATIIGQCSGAFLGFVFVHKFAPEIDINMRGFRPNKSAISDIYKIGFPAILVQSIASIMSLGMNNILLMFSTTATAVFGVYFKLQSFIFMPVYGLTNGLIPIVGYNYGAGQTKRIKEAFRLATCIAIGIMLLGTLLFNLIPTQLLGLFDASDEMSAIGTVALRVISLSFPLAGYSLVGCALFQAMGNSVHSLIVSAARQLVILLPAAYYLALASGLDFVWYAFPIAELVSVIICIALTKYTFKKKLNP